MEIKPRRGRKKVGPLRAWSLCFRCGNKFRSELNKIHCPKTHYRHLVIGAGRMGRFHGKLLSDTGDEVFYADLGFSAKHFRIRYSKNLDLDSILICSPPETHAEMIRELAPLKISMFVEKPLATTQEELDSLPDTPLMVACNWRYCGCKETRHIKTIRFGYKSRDKRPELDFIHFVDMMWHRYDAPRSGDVKGLTLSYEPKSDVKRPFYFVFDPTADKPYHFRDEFEIHKDKICPMFKRQMKLYREFVAKKRESPNPLKDAKQRMSWLLGVLHNPQNTP